MNDRFKFRAWDRERKLLIYSWSESTTEQRKIYEDVYGKDETYNCWQCCQLDCLDNYGENFIIEQCTGLKDKNGKLIYEGDVVEVSEAYENGIYKIEFCQSDCEYNLYNTEGNFMYQLTKSMARYMEVIGNIHENADLIKVGRK